MEDDVQQYTLHLFCPLFSTVLGYGRLSQAGVSRPIEWTRRRASRGGGVLPQDLTGGGVPVEDHERGKCRLDSRRLPGVDHFVPIYIHA